MRCSAVPFAGGLLALLTAAPLHAEPAKLAPELQAEAHAAGQSSVFIKLRPPALPRGASPGARRNGIATTQSRVRAAAGEADLRIEHRLGAIAGLIATVTPDGLAALEAQPDVVRVDPLATGYGALLQNVPLIRGDVVHRRGILGGNTTVAVLDTGIEVTHPDVAGRVVGQACFCSPNCCPNGEATQLGAGSAATSTSHGLHTTGIVASAGIISAPGTAPNARVLAVKVLDEQNRGFLTDWIAALDWILTDRPDVQAVNMSLASDIIYKGFCDQPEDPNDLNAFIIAFAEAFELLRARGVPVFASAGNPPRNADGANDSIALPACVEDAIAVGAVDRFDRLWRNGHLSGAIDLLAPGVSIVSDGVNGGLSTATGTSMSTAFVTGSAALLLSMNPGLSVAELETVLKETGVPVAHRQGTLRFARIDDLGAVNEVWRTTSPLLGGGSRESDCLVSWSFAATGGSRPRPVAGIVCHDSDPVCDRNPTPARCGLDLSICLNRADGRVPMCRTTSAIQSYQLGKPSASGDAIDAANRAAITRVLPATPVAAGGVCTDTLRLTVPVGSRSLRFAAQATDGRRDDDKLRLVCLPAQ